MQIMEQDPKGEREDIVALRSHLPSHLLNLVAILLLLLCMMCPLYESLTISAYVKSLGLISYQGQIYFGWSVIDIPL